MEHYSVVKNNDIMKFEDKWMELDQNIPNKVTQAQKKQTQYIFTHKWYLILDKKQRITRLQSITLEKQDNTEDTKIGACIILGKGNRWDLWVNWEWRDRGGDGEWEHLGSGWWIGGWREWENNEIGILLNGAIVRLGRNLLPGKLPGNHMMIPDKTPSNSGDDAWNGLLM